VLRKELFVKEFGGLSRRSNLSKELFKLEL
jgi:hypothetical protein